MSNKAQKRGLIPKLRFPEFRDAEEWDGKQLGDICQPQQWATISSTDLVAVGFSVYGANGFIGYYNDFNHEFETVAVTCRGSTCGEVSLIPPKSYITGNSMCLDGINAKQHSYHFVFQLLKHRGFRDVISGSAQPQIVGNAIKRMKIALPKQAEQEKIADCLASLDERITLEAQKLDTLKTHKKWLMQQLFPAEGETSPKLRFPKFRDAWNENSLGDISDSISSGKDKSDSDGAYDLYGSTGVIGKTSSDTYKGKFILAARVGANAGLLTKSNGKFGVTDNTLVIQLKKSEFIDFIFYYLESLGLNKLIFGSGQPLITGGQLKALSLCIPDGLEQQKIADCLASLDDLITAQTQKLAALKTHKKGLMQQLFPVPDEVTA